MDFRKYWKHAKDASFEEITKAVEEVKANPPEPNPFNEDLNKLARLDFSRTWEERDKFITWVTLLSTGALIFSLNIIMSHFDVVRHFLLLEVSVGLLIVSVVTCVLYKLHWSIKYAFDKLDLTILEHLWKSRNTKNEIQKHLNKGEEVSNELRDEFMRLHREEYDLISRKGNVWSKIEKYIHGKIRFVEWDYRVCLVSFAIGFAILIGVMFYSMHFHYAELTKIQ